jgi:glutathione S-transferase
MSEDTLVFYHAAPSRSSIVHWRLEEVGAHYRIVPIDLGRDEQRQPDYLAVNPMDKVPAIVHLGTVITEVAAICAWLAETFPAAGLAPPVGAPDRGSYLRWLFFEPASLEPAIVDRLLQRPPGPARALSYGDFNTTLDVVARAVQPGPYLLGDRFSTADVLVGSALRWGGMVGVVPERAEFTAYLARLAERPALQRAMARDQELAARSGS